MLIYEETVLFFSVYLVFFVSLCLGKIIHSISAVHNLRTEKF